MSLNKEDSEQLYAAIRDKQKDVMKEVLNNIRLALDDSRFDHFKKLTFNAFGKSGLDKKTRDIISEFSDEPLDEEE